jgi:uncharacterized phage protein (TIGR02220 family)
MPLLGLEVRHAVVSDEYMKPDIKGPWIALYTKTADSDSFQTLSCAERSVFLQSFFMAARMEYDCVYHRRTYHLLPGQFVCTLPDLAQRCGRGCSVKIVRRTLDKLKACLTWADGRADERADAPHLVTFINWGVYQWQPPMRADDRALPRNSIGQTDGTQSPFAPTENDALPSHYKVITQTRQKSVSTLPPEVAEVLAYLNEKVKRNFKNPGDIPARLKDYSVEDCKTVIDKKCREWLNTDLARHLDPVTLFRPSNFDRYLNQVEISNEAMTFGQWLDKHPDLDYRRFDGDLAQAAGYQRALKEAERNPLVHLDDKDYREYEKATRIKTREAQRNIQEAKR